MRYLGIDYGSRHIGLALSDVRGTFAFPLEVIPNDSHAVENVAHVISEKKIDAIVIGDTKADSGVANQLTERCQKFAAQIGSRTTLSVSFAREAWSSFEAARYAPDEKKRDDAAAAIILQRFLDSKPKAE